MTLVISTSKMKDLKQGRFSIKLVNSNISLVSTPKDDNLLETLINNSIEVDFQCKEGYCGACKIKKVKGDVIYLTDPIAFKNHDEILPCCCRPKSDLEIEL